MKGVKEVKGEQGVQGVQGVQVVQVVHRVQGVKEATTLASHHWKTSPTWHWTLGASVGITSASGKAQVKKQELN